MFDLSTRLRDNPTLLTLLAHYARLGGEDQTCWQDRVMRMDGVDGGQLTTLHGVLIAFDGIEQNTGHAVQRADGALGSCYRVTLEGLREFYRLQGVEAPHKEPDAAEKPLPKRSRKKKEQPAAEAGTSPE